MKALLNFRFNQFPEHLTHTLINLFSSKSHCDVRFIGEDGIPVTCHKVILTAFSRVLNDVIKENSVQPLDIKIQGMNHDDIETIVQFMYHGEVSIAHAEVDKFLRAAKFLGVSQLSDQCKANIAELNTEFSVEINEETILEETPKSHISREYDDTAKTIDYEEINVENLDEYGIKIREDQEEVNLKEEINDESLVITNNFNEEDEQHHSYTKVGEQEYSEVKKIIWLLTKKYPEFVPRKGWDAEIVAIDKDCCEITIGEPVSDFNVFSGILYTHNFYRKVNGRDGSEDRAFCLMCWKKDKTPTLYKIAYGNIRGLKDHMASKHAEFVGKYVKQRQKVEEMKEQKRQRDVEVRQQPKSEESNIRFERKKRKIERKEQEIQSINPERVLKKNKELDQEAQANMNQFSSRQLTAFKQTAPKDEDDIRFAEIVLQEEFTIGEPSDLNLSVFSSVFYSHNFYRKCENGQRVLCLMCLRSVEQRKVFLRLGDHGNTRGIVCHMKWVHPEHAKKFLLLNEMTKGLRKAKREGRL